jgi:hypothetical protein
MKKKKSKKLGKAKTQRRKKFCSWGVPKSLPALVKASSQDKEVKAVGFGMNHIKFGIKYKN